MLTYGSAPTGSSQPFVGGLQTVSESAETMLSLMLSESANVVTTNANAASVAAQSAAALAAISAIQTGTPALLNYIVSNPGAMLLAALPRSLPSTSNAWWVDGGIVARS